MPGDGELGAGPASVDDDRWYDTPEDDEDGGGAARYNSGSTDAYVHAHLRDQRRRVDADAAYGAGGSPEPRQRTLGECAADALQDICARGDQAAFDAFMQHTKNEFHEGLDSTKAIFDDPNERARFIENLDVEKEDDQHAARKAAYYQASLEYFQYRQAAMVDDGPMARAVGNDDDNGNGNVSESGFVKTAGMQYTVYDAAGNLKSIPVSFTIRVDDLNKQQYVATRCLTWNNKAEEMPQVCAVMVEERNQGKMLNADGTPKTVLMGYKESSWFGNQMSGRLIGQPFRRYFRGKLPGPYARGTVKAIHMLNAQCITTSFPTKTAEDPNNYIGRTKESARRLFLQSVKRLTKSDYTKRRVNPIKGNEPYLAFLINERQKKHIEAFYRNAKGQGRNPPIIPNQNDMDMINQQALVDLQHDIQNRRGEFENKSYDGLSHQAWLDLKEGVGDYWKQNEFSSKYAPDMLHGVDGLRDEGAVANPVYDNAPGAKRPGATPNPTYVPDAGNDDPVYAVPGGGGESDDDDYDVVEPDGGGAAP